MDNAGETSSSGVVQPPCMSVNVSSSCYESCVSVTEDVTVRSVRGVQSLQCPQQMRIPAPVKAHWLLTSSHRAPAGPEGSGPDPVWAGMAMNDPGVVQAPCLRNVPYAHSEKCTYFVGVLTSA